MRLRVALLTALISVLLLTRPTAAFPESPFTLISKNVGAKLNRVAWHPTGDYALITSESTSTVWKYKAGDKTLTAFKQNSRIPYYDISWNPDGSYALLVGYGYLENTGLTATVSKFWHAGQTITSVGGAPRYSLNRVAIRPGGAYALISGPYVVGGTYHQVLYKWTNSGGFELKSDTNVASGQQAYLWQDIQWKPDGAQAWISVSGSNASTYFTWSNTASALWRVPVTGIDMNSWSRTAMRRDGSYMLVSVWGGRLVKFFGTYASQMPQTGFGFADGDFDPLDTFGVFVGGTTVRVFDAVAESFTAYAGSDGTAYRGVAVSPERSAALVVGENGQDRGAVILFTGVTPVRGDIDTLVLANFQRMKEIDYGAGEVDNLRTRVVTFVATDLPASGHKAVLLDLDTVSSLRMAYSNWNGRETSVTATNALVSKIDSYVEDRVKNIYPNTRFLMFVGSHEVIPMKAREDDYTFGGAAAERDWAAGLAGRPGGLGYFTAIYGADPGYYLTDTIYSDLSHIKPDRLVYHDEDLNPELAVGRLVETPAQMTGVMNEYASRNGLNDGAGFAALGSWDFMDGAQRAHDAMEAAGHPTDHSLISSAYDSQLAPPVMDLSNDLIFMAGHGNYNWITTRRWDLGFVAGSELGQGDTRDLSSVAGSVVITDGCHNGVSFGNKKAHASNETGTAWAEFPEDFAAKGAVAFVGATGYTAITLTGGNNDPSKAGANEELSAEVARNFVGLPAKPGQPPIPALTIGEAFKKADNDYYAKYHYSVTVAGGGKRYYLSTWDRRVLAINTLYGVPTYQIGFGGGTGAAGYTTEESSSSSEPGDVSQDVTVTVLSSPYPEYEYTDPQGHDRYTYRIQGAESDVRPGAPILPAIDVISDAPGGTEVTEASWDQGRSTTFGTDNKPVVMAEVGTVGDTETAWETATVTSDETGPWPKSPVRPLSSGFSLRPGTASDTGFVGIRVKPVFYDDSGGVFVDTLWRRMVLHLKMRYEPIEGLRAEPNQVLPDGKTEVLLTAVPKANYRSSYGGPLSVFISTNPVAGDLRSIGGSAGAFFYDDGSHGDRQGNDGIHSLTTTVATGTAEGTEHIPVTATFNNGEAGGEIELEVVRQPVGLTLGRSRSIVTYGQSVVLYGILSAGDTGVPQAAMSAEGRNVAGAAVWVGSLTSSATGSFSFQQVPVRHTVYSVEYGGTTLYQPASAATTVWVRPKMTLRGPSRATGGTYVTVQGHVSPRHPGKTVELQYWHGGKWRRLTKAALNRYSDFVKRFVLRSTMKIRAYFRGDADHLANRSATLTIRKR